MRKATSHIQKITILVKDTKLSNVLLCTWTYV